jgi:hypothetical protein
MKVGKAIENFSIAKAILLNTIYICRLQESEGPGLARRLLSWLPVLVVLALLFLLLKVGKRYRLIKNREGPNVMSIDESYKTNDKKPCSPFSKHLDEIQIGNPPN